MASNQMAAVTIFRKEDKELYEWYKSADLRVSRAQLGREAFECLRLFDGSLDRARAAKVALEEKESKDEHR